MSTNHNSQQSTVKKGDIINFKRSSISMRGKIVGIGEKYITVQPLDSAGNPMVVWGNKTLRIRRR